jgi:hypothetical protein
MDQGSVNSIFTKIQSFESNGGDSASVLVHTLNSVSDGLVLGRIYSFKFRSAN